MFAANQSLLFDDLGPRRVQADFAGRTLSSDAGALLLRQVDRSLGLTQSLALCFGDGRNQFWVEHSVQELLRQRIYGTALGYEDLNDHARLRLDPLLAAACEKTDPLGEERLLPQHRGIALASPSTLNRLELSNNKNSRCHKLPYDPARIEACLLKMGVRCLPKHAPEVVLDLDAMGHRLHGFQEGRHFNAYDDDYCYLPPYVVAGQFPLCSRLRTAGHEAAHGGDPDQERFAPARLYEELYCARGDMENRLKQQVLDLKADRMSTHHLASNQLRLWEAAFAYLLLERLRTQGLAGTELERATVGTIRLKLLKVAAQVRISVRRVYVQMSSAFPLQELLGLCHRRLMAIPLWSD